VALGDDTLFLAELGLIFLMFMVGLEFSLDTLLAARTEVLLAGSLQVGATIATIAAALWWLGLDLRLAILLGGVTSMSSTAVTMNQLAEQGEISSQHGCCVVSTRKRQGGLLPRFAPSSIRNFRNWSAFDDCAA